MFTLRLDSKNNIQIDGQQARISSSRMPSIHRPMLRFLSLHTRYSTCPKLDSSRLAKNNKKVIKALFDVSIFLLSWAMSWFLYFKCVWEWKLDKMIFHEEKKLFWSSRAYILTHTIRSTQTCQMFAVDLFCFMSSKWVKKWIAKDFLKLVSGDGVEMFMLKIWQKESDNCIGS